MQLLLSLLVYSQINYDNLSPKRVFTQMRIRYLLLKYYFLVKSTLVDFTSGVNLFKRHTYSPTFPFHAFLTPPRILYGKHIVYVFKKQTNKTSANHSSPLTSGFSKLTILLCLSP